MASIIKNQILKYLSRYFKNLSTEKVNFNTIKGEGKLDSLELDEIALTDLLELPAWMRITKAHCNEVTFNIPWTKLKSEPMIWKLDDVKVEIETCEELRSQQEEGLPNILQQQGKYNTINRIVDGMTITVNNVSIKFTSATFTAHLIISRIQVDSKSSAWEKCDLRHTRIKDTKRGQILLFKELKWQSLKIEAKSITEEDLPPLRLITNEAVCRLIIKKRLSDCFIMGSKLVLILEDFLWVLTDSQLKAALHFLDYLSVLIKKANDVVRKKKAARKLDELPEYQAQLSQQEAAQRKSAVSHIFQCHDVVETSYHIVAHKVDLHLSDDPGPLRSNHPGLQNGAAIRVKLTCFQVDYYPYHLATKDRTHWGVYSVERYPHPKWLAESQKEFRNLLLSLVQDDFPSSQRSPVSKTSSPQEGESSQPRRLSNNDVRKYLTTQYKKIMTSCIVLRIANFTIDRVTMNNTKGGASSKEFIKADKDRYRLPESEILHAEFTYYYYPGDMQFPLPPPKFYVQIYPVQIHYDVVTIIWLNTFFLNLHKSLLNTSTAKTASESTSQLFYVEVKLEITQPRIIFEMNHERSIAKDKPRSLHFQISRITLSNTRTNEALSSRSNLAKVVNTCQMRSLFLSEDFPSLSSDCQVVTEKFLSHAQGKDNVRELPAKLQVIMEDDLPNLLLQEMLWIDSKDVWCINLESVWGEFYGVRAVGNRPVSFLDAFPLTVWLHADPLMNANKPDKTANVHVLVSVTNLISVQLNQYQANFLSKISKSFSELTTFLTIDTDKVMKDEKNTSVVVASIVPQIEVTLVTSSQGTGKESSGGDIESSSVVPDSSSLDTHSMYWNNSITIEETRTRVTAKLNKDNSIVSIADNAVHFQTSETAEATVKGLPSFSQLKKGITNIMPINFKSKSMEDNSDVLSIRSDDSSDTENYLTRTGSDQLYPDDKDAMFKINPKRKSRGQAADTLQTMSDIEIANEANELGMMMVGDTPTTTPSEKDSFGSTFKRKDNVAAITLKLSRLEFMMQSFGLRGSLKLQIGNAGVEECFSIPWDELQNKFNARTRAWCEVENEKSYVVSEARIKLRYENLIQPPKFASSSSGGGSSSSRDYCTNVNMWKDSQLNVIVNNLLLELQSQTIKCLTEFVEDLKLNDGDKEKAVPFEILVDNVQLQFREEFECNGDSACPIVIHRLRVFREDGGSIKIQPVDAADDDAKTTLCKQVSEKEVQSMRSEIELLKKRLAAMEYLNEENQTLLQCRKETIILRDCLQASQDQLSELLEEKRQLLEYIHRLRASSQVSENITCKR